MNTIAAAQIACIAAISNLKAPTIGNRATSDEIGAARDFLADFITAADALVKAVGDEIQGSIPRDVRFEWRLFDSQLIAALEDGALAELDKLEIDEQALDGLDELLALAGDE